jgi:hypothetical protein
VHVLEQIAERTVEWLLPFRTHDSVFREVGYYIIEKSNRATKIQPTARAPATDGLPTRTLRLGLFL